MYKVKMHLKCHTPWFRIPPDLDKYENLSNEEFIRKSIEEEQVFRQYKCSKFLLELNNFGDIAFIYDSKIDTIDWENDALLFSQFVSLCNDFNCEYTSDIEINGEKDSINFYYPQENGSIPKIKDLKYMEIGLEDISDFNLILDNLFGNYQDYYKLMMTTYFNDLYDTNYKGAHLVSFKNCVGCIESIVSKIYKTEYINYRNCNKEKIKDLSNKINLNLDDFIMPKSFSLEKKLKDAIELVGKILKINPKDDYKKLCKSIADTRNLYSHYFERKKEHSYLDDSMLPLLNISLRTIFRILLLYEIGIEKELLYKNFMRNKIMIMYLSRIFDLDDIKNNMLF